jgi:nucleotide-binding universal stress UspA family protein
MRYLVATDGSKEGKHAVEYAAKQAAAFDATLEIVHVVTPETEIEDGEIIFEGRKKATDSGRRRLENAVELAADSVSNATLETETHLLTGRPTKAISERANSTEVDALFVGHRGLSAKREEVVGSVAKSLVDKADVPVTVVR